jgi:murein DD-endopeptidase MepM/ murein hydrolase activator NlpD
MMRKHPRVSRFAPLLLPVLLAACAGSGSKTQARIDPAPASYFNVKARTGDSSATLAQRYGVQEEDILALNDIRASQTLGAGVSIRVPAYGALYAPKQDEPPAVAIKSDRPPIERLALKDATPPRAARATPIPRPKPEQAVDGEASAQALASWLDFDWLKTFRAEAPDAKALAHAPKLLWPVTGPIIADFGASASGERNDGINIATKSGTPVRASAAGTVSYVGSELKAYGNLILIRHDNSFVTAYAHSDEVKVSRGMRVTRGQIIASAGATGNVDEPQVHFELRLGAKPLDPKPFLVTDTIAAK